MRNEHDKILVEELTDSFRGQFVRYCSLRDVTRQVMGKLVLTRGDFSRVNDMIRTKQRLLEDIEAERTRIARQVMEWQQRKEQIARSTKTDLLSEVLQQVADVLQEFLDDEAQLRKYLESVMAGRAAPSLST